MKKKAIIFPVMALLATIGFAVDKTQFSYPEPDEVLTQEQIIETFEETGALEKVDGLDRVGLDSHSPEEKLLEVMHQMTHQKIAADQKWVAVPMTTKNIGQMESIVSTSDKIRNPNVKKELLGIITKWEHGDFSEANEDHNYIWGLQDGTLGKARGLLGKEEELQFIDEWFLNEEKTAATNR